VNEINIQVAKVENIIPTVFEEDPGTVLMHGK